MRKKKTQAASCRHRRCLWVFFWGYNHDHLANNAAAGACWFPYICWYSLNLCNNLLERAKKSDAGCELGRPILQTQMVSLGTFICRYRLNAFAIICWKANQSFVGTRKKKRRKLRAREANTADTDGVLGYVYLSV